MKLFVDITKKAMNGLDKYTKLALIEVADEILRLSNSEVPFDKGSLSKSGRVEEKQNSVEVGYHTDYAKRLHEHPEYNFQNNRKGKYLEDPIKNNLSRLAKIVGDRVAMEIRR